ncbi:MAG: phosphotransferase [Halocynthiibacter sp.]
MTDIDQAVLRALALPCWSAPKNARPLEGGITNVNILLSDQGRDYVVRLGHDIPEHGVMRFNELAISRAAHAAGVSPAVHFAEPGALVLEYIDAAPLTEAEVRDPETLRQIVALVGRVHRDVATHLRGPVLTFWVFHVLRDYAATLRARASSHLPLLGALAADAALLEASVGPIDLVLGHNDLLAGNILRGPDRLWLIDWEYGGFNSPLFGLGAIATNNGLGPDDEDRMLGAYYGKPPDAGLRTRYTAMKCASLLRETMWSMVSELTSKIDFDYAAYTTENLTRYHRALAEFKSLKGPK